jgi:AcrR family transcriptional regulator
MSDISNNAPLERKGSPRVSTAIEGGRVNQKLRTRLALVRACRELVEAGGEVTMPAVAKAALVSEATAYRYFPAFVSLLAEAMADARPDPAVALELIADRTDPAERVAYATEVLMHHVLAYERSVRATIAATIDRPQLVADLRPGYRFGLIDAALEPVTNADPPVNADTLAQLKRDLAIIVSAEALFTLTDLCSLTPEQAITSAARTAATVTQAALRSQPEDT